MKYEACDVTEYEREDGEPYFVVQFGIESIKVFLWTIWDGQEEDRAGVVTTNIKQAGSLKGDYPYNIDGDGDPTIEIGDFRFVFRFPNHPDAGTGNTAFDPDEPGRTPLSPSATPTDGLRRGDLSDTPFQF